jgi:hypothetical protein
VTRGTWMAAWTALATAGCISIPSVVVVDRKTALEAQVAGEYSAAEEDLLRASLAAGAMPLSRQALEASGAAARGTYDDLVEPWTVFRGDADVTDDLLSRRCLGEAADGTLVPRRETCAGETDDGAVASLVQRANRARQQVWAWLASRAPGRDEAAVRSAWRTTRLDEVPCGAPVQAPGGHWEDRRCD